MNTTTIKRKPRIAIFAFFAVFAVIFSTINPLTAYAASQDKDNPTEVATWEQLAAAVDGGGYIKLTGDIVTDGKTIEIKYPLTITSDGATIRPGVLGSGEKYAPMFTVKSGGNLTIGENITLSGQIDGKGCGADSAITTDMFTGDVSADGKTYNPKAFFIQVEGGGSATLNGTISDFVTSRDKETTPKYVAPVVANGSGATFNIGNTGVIKNNLVGYIVDDNKANQDAQSIKQYVKGAGPNVPRVPNAATQKANAAGFDRTRNKDALIDEGVAGSGVTATAGAVIYKGGAQGDISGAITNNRADTGGIMVSGDGTQVNINEGTSISKNVGVQFGGGSTTEQGGTLTMYNGEMFGGSLHDNTALTRGGAVLADSDGVQIAEGKLQNNMSRMLGGAVYVMGDHPLYTYTMRLTGLYVHDNTAVSGVVPGEKAEENAKLQTALSAPNTCEDTTGPLFSGTVAVNTDDMTDGPGTHGTGGGLWLCAYGNTIFSAGATDKVVIKGNYATGTAPLDNPVYSNYIRNSPQEAAQKIREDIAYNSANSSATTTGKTGGNDIHADTGDSGTVTIDDLHESSGWINENASTGSDVPYMDQVSDGRLNLIYKGDASLQNMKVEVSGNIARRGGGLAADGTYILGEPDDQVSMEPAMELAKSWGASTNKAPVTIRVEAVTEDGKRAPVADVPLDGVANPPASEFDSVQELAPSGNTWKGKFSLPLQLTATDGTKIPVLSLTLNYEDAFQNEVINPSTMAGKRQLASLIKMIKIKNTHDGVVDRDAVNADLKQAVTLTFNNGLHFECTELEEDASGNLVSKDSYIFTHEQVNLGEATFSLQSTSFYEKVWNSETNMYEDKEVYQSHIFGINLALPMTNDDHPLVEKYVNKNVHADIVNFDQEFTYDILAYVPVSATEFTISDTLVKGLEFADKDGNPTQDPWEAVQSVAVKYSNNHKVGDEGTVTSGDIVKTNTNGTPIDFILWETGWPEGQGYPEAWVTGWPNQGYGPQMAISGNKLTVKIDERGKQAGGNNPFDLQQARGRWVQVTFNARIKDEYRTLAALKELQANVDGKTTSWEKNDTNKQAPDARDLTVTNGDLNIIAALQTMVGPDEPLWIGVEKTGLAGRLFAKSVNGKYFVITKADYRAGKQWILLSDSTETYDGDTLSDLLNEAKGRYSGLIQSARAVDATNPSDGDRGWVNRLAEHPAFDGSSIGKVAEGPSRYFAEVTDGEGNTSYYQSTPPDDKTGGQWEKCVTKSDIDNAKSKIGGDGALRYLDTSSTSFTIGKDVKNWPVISEEEHEGMANQASYNVKFGNGAEGTYKTNTVTIKPDTTKLEVVKTWQDGAAEWPEGVTSITIGLFTLKGQDEAIVKGTIAEDGTFTSGGDTQATFTLTADKNTVTITDLPRLKDVTYFAKEIKIDDVAVDDGATYGVVRIGDIVKFIVSRIDKTVSGDEGETYASTINNEKVEVEKYVNNDVHANLVEFDKVFKYDIMVYVPKGSTELTITDPLVSALEFAKIPANGDLNAKAEKAEQASESVASVVAKAKNDHTVGSTVAGADENNAGVPVTPTSMNIDNNTLTVKFESVTGETGIQGKWVQVTFYAKYTDTIIKAATIGDTKKIEDNGAVLGGVTPHEGTPNKATASFTVGNIPTFDLDTNEVTVTPETVQLHADKEWRDKDGNVVVGWPQGAKITFALMNGENEVASVVMDKKGKVSFPVQPKLVGVTYTVVEKSVEGVDATQVGTPVISADGTTTFTNKLVPEKHEVIFSKHEFGDNTKELSGAEIKVTDSEGNVVDQWTSGDDKDADGNILPHVMQLEAGEYTFEEVNAPEGFDKITTTVTFIVDEDGKVTLKGAYENINGEVSVVDINHLILEDMPIKLTDLQVVKTWKNNAGWSVATPGGLWPEGATVAITVTDNEGTVVGTDTLSDSHRSAVFTNLPEGRTYTVTEEVSGAFCKETTVSKSVKSGETVEFVNELLPRKSKSAIEVLKVDATTGEALAGAGLKITGTAKDGEKVDLTWTSGSVARMFELKSGSYTLSETSVPKGYLKADDIAFEIDELTGQLILNGEPASSVMITMKDAPEPTPAPSETEAPTPTPTHTATAPVQHVRSATTPLVQTGSSMGYPFVLTALLLGVGAGLLIVRRRTA